MSRGRRYDDEPKLNMKKVFAVIIAIIVIIMFIFMIKGLLTKDTKTGKIISKSYFAVYKDDKWGVIDETGSNTIDPSYKEMIVIPNNKVGVFICTYDTNYETGEYKTKVLNEKNQEIFTDYSKVEAIQNKDVNDNLLYEQNVLKVQKDGKYGLINLTGKQVVSIEYDEITAISGIENSFKVKKDGKYGIVDSEGKIVIQPQYADIDVLGKDNKSGFIVKNDTGKYGIADYSNNPILEAKYDSVEKVYGNDLYLVTVSGKQKLVKKDGTDVLTSGFDTIKQILSSQENAVIFSKSGKYGIMNLSGETLIDAQYDSLEETKLGTFIAKKADKYGIINISKEEKIPFEYNSIVYNEKADIYVVEDANLNSNILNSNLETKVSGMLLELNTDKGFIKLRVDDNYKYYNFKFEEKQEVEIFPNRTLFLSKKDGKYGYVDKSGKVVVDYIYDDAIEQNDYGFSAVKKDGKWGSIDSNGAIVQEPTYNLDEYLLVDFIGRWHLGSDINMNYYNQL
ncbi:MAG: WG repeat-containing protein [Clostridia bacterium]|nr:WG repeat-containing protein [Clostridia bacterium]